MYTNISRMFDIELGSGPSFLQAYYGMNYGMELPFVEIRR